MTSIVLFNLRELVEVSFITASMIMGVNAYSDIDMVENSDLKVYKDVNLAVEVEVEVDIAANFCLRLCPLNTIILLVF